MRTLSGRLCAGGLVALLLAGCAGAAATAAPLPVATATVAPATATVAPATATPAPTASAAPPVSALVGSWVGTYDCQRIADVLRTAGMEAQILPTIVENGLLPGITDPADVPDPDDPCDGAIELAHSHFFTAGGLFGSRDQRDRQVDDGTWSMVDDDTFAINGTNLFDFVIEGAELRMEPVSVGACPADSTAWCPESWKLMVAMPGMAWTREE
jgi:hypothetical protein